MKLWYQTYISPDQQWGYYEETCVKYIPKIARPDTQVDIHGVEKRAPKMLVSTYLQYLHVGQVFEKALQAEREGYDAFILGGMRDFGYTELPEILDIPVVFPADTCYHVACLMAPKFSVLHTNESRLKGAAGVIKRYGLDYRYVPGVHIGYQDSKLMEDFKKDPQGVIANVKKVAKKVIEQDAGVLVPGHAALGAFLADQGVREIDGVPVLDNVATVIKMAEMRVDFHRLGIPKGKKGVIYNISKEEIIAARKLYGVE